MKHLPLKLILFLALILGIFSISAYWFQPTSNNISDCQQDTYNGEHPVFADNSLARIDLALSVTDLELIFEDLTSNKEYPASFAFTRGNKIDTISKVGFKLKGVNSLNRDITKKSFEVVFNSFNKGAVFYGLKKLKLSGQHKDPTMMRAKIAADLFKEMEVATPRTTHIEVYINGTYYGLYLGTEPIDENFLTAHFNSKSGNLYKATNDASLGYLGAEANRYKTIQEGKRVYQLQTNTDRDNYSDLANFINRLHLSKDEEFQSAIDRTFNVDRFLRTLAVDIFIGNWEGYSFNSGNYYLYHNPITDKFEYIPFQFENTFGIDETSRDWATRNIYAWAPKNRFIPLHERILKVEDFKNRYSYYMSKLIKKYANPPSLNTAIDCRKKMIQKAAEMDQFRTEDFGYGIQKFNAAFGQGFEEGEKGHVKYGLKEYIEKRYNSAIEQLDLININPIVFNSYYEPSRPRNTEPLTILSSIEDEAKNPPNVELHYKCNNTTWKTLAMKDDGNSDDKGASDDIFGVSFLPEPNSNNIDYYIEATDATGLTTRYPKTGNHSIQMRIGPKIFINEWMAKNDSIITDSKGDFDPWIEIYNGEEEAIWLGDLFLTNDFSNRQKWSLPSKTIMPNEYMIIWLDGQTDQGPDHAPFGFDSKRQMGIFGSASINYALIDTFSFQQSLPNAAYGLEEDGKGIGTLLPRSTPGYPNRLSTVKNYTEVINSAKVDTIYPNPFDDIATFAFRAEKPLFIKASIYNIKGERIVDLTKRQYSSGTHKIAWSISPKQKESGVRTFVFKLLIRDEQGIEFEAPMKRFYWRGN